MIPYRYITIGLEKGDIKKGREGGGAYQ